MVAYVYFHMGDRNGWLATEKPKNDGKGLKISVPQKVRCSVAWLFLTTASNVQNLLVANDESKRTHRDF
jgi:hypothetical protein